MAAYDIRNKLFTKLKKNMKESFNNKYYFYHLICQLLFLDDISSYEFCDPTFFIFDPWTIQSSLPILDSHRGKRWQMNIKQFVFFNFFLLTFASTTKTNFYVYP